MLNMLPSPTSTVIDCKLNQSMKIGICDPVVSSPEYDILVEM